MLLDGVPNSLKCRRGVRRGNPLSGELICSKSWEFICSKALLTRHSNGNDMQTYQWAWWRRIPNYSICSWYYNPDEGFTEWTCFFLEALLNTLLSPLASNWIFISRSLIPRNVLEVKGVTTSRCFWCVVGTITFTYLGLPMGTTRSKVVDLAHLTDKIERRLIANVIFLNYEE